MKNTNPLLPLPLLVFLLPLAVYFVTLNGFWATDHPSSLIDLDWAIYAHHSFAIGQVGDFQKNSVDIFAYNGSYYSASAPGAAILAFPFVALGFYLQGGFAVFGYVLPTSELFVAIANSLAAFVLYRIGKDFFFGELAAAFVAFSYAFSTISWPFATFFFQSDVSALFVLSSVYFLLSASKGEPGHPSRDALLCGVSVGVALTVDYVDGILIFPILGYLLLGSKGPRAARLERGVLFTMASAAGVLLLFAYNYASFGNPFAASEQVYLGGAGVLGAFSFPLLDGAYLNLFTPLRGIFVYSPVLLVGVVGLLGSLRPSKFDSRVAMLLVLFLCIFVPYSMWYAPTAGNSYGPRFLVAAIPLLLIPAGFILETLRSALRRSLVYLLYLAGVVLSGLASFVGAVPPDQMWFSSPFVKDVVPAIFALQLDPWWASQSGPAAWVVIGVVLGAVGLAPLFTGALSISGSGPSKRSAAEARSAQPGPAPQTPERQVHS
ncbi:MAG: glycosyltransferase family 39 protein [archaeon]|nr:MAG: glycosyltransferase family 39 protein [archaeon]